MSYLQSLAVLAVMVALTLVAADVHHLSVLVLGLVGLVLIPTGRYVARLVELYRRPVRKDQAAYSGHYSR